MKRADLNKILTEFMRSETPKQSMIPRRYTLTFSDRSVNLFLTIGPRYNFSNIKSIKNSVLAEWVEINSKYELHIFCYIGNKSSNRKHEDFNKKIPLILETICLSDKAFLENNTKLKKAPIFVNYYSNHYNNYIIEYWGTPDNYL